MRGLILALCLAAGTPALAQEDAPAAGQAVTRKPGHAARDSQREAERAAALARGRERFFSQQSGFEHPEYVPPTVKLPDGFGVVPLNPRPLRRN